MCHSEFYRLSCDSIARQIYVNGCLHSCKLPRYTAKSYSDLEYSLRKLEEFKFSKSKNPNVYGTFIVSAYKDKGMYYVYSYNTLIAAIKEEGKKIVFFNFRDYSNTTLKLQQIIRRLFCPTIQWENVGKRIEILKEKRGQYFYIEEVVE